MHTLIHTHVAYRCMTAQFQTQTDTHARDHQIVLRPVLHVLYLTTRNPDHPESKANKFMEFGQQDVIKKFHDQKSWEEKYKTALSLRDPRAQFIAKRLIFDESPKTLSEEDFKMSIIGIFRISGSSVLLC